MRMLATQGRQFRPAFVRSLSAGEHVRSPRHPSRAKQTRPTVARASYDAGSDSGASDGACAAQGACTRGTSAGPRTGSAAPGPSRQGERRRCRTTASYSREVHFNPYDPPLVKAVCVQKMTRGVGRRSPFRKRLPRLRPIPPASLGFSLGFQVGLRFRESPVEMVTFERDHSRRGG